MQEQPEVAAAAPEVQAVEETTPAVAATEESDKKMDVEEEAQNGEKTADNIVKTTAQADHKDFKKNRKYDPSTQPVSDDPVKIRGQVCHPPGPRPGPMPEGRKTLFVSVRD